MKDVYIKIVDGIYRLVDCKNKTCYAVGSKLDCLEYWNNNKNDLNLLKHE